MSTRLLMMRCTSFVTAIVLMALVGSVGAGSPAQSRALNLNGQKVDPLQAGNAKAVVIIFIRTDCPISNRYAPEVRRLHEKFASAGVAFWLVYPDAGESVEAIRQHLKEYDYHLSALRDPQHALVKMAGARVTPEAAVFVAGRLVYRGRIDNRFVAFGKARPAPTAHDLEEILDAILKGRTPATEITTPAVGCFISDL